MLINYTEKNTKLRDSYLFDESIGVIVDIIIAHRKEFNMPVTRTKQSYINEIKAHNRLYKLGLFRSHTKDTDLEEPIQKWKEIVYAILGV